MKIFTFFKTNIHKSIDIECSEPVSNEELGCFLKKEMIRDFNKLPEIQKIIFKALVKEFKSATKPGVINTPFNLFDITEEVMEEFKNDFGMTPEELKTKEGRALRSVKYKCWLKKLNMNYETDRKYVQRMVNSIYNYTNGQLDYRNTRMREQRGGYEHSTTKAERKIRESAKLF